MQYDVSSPKEYLEQLPDNWQREKLIDLRAMIQAMAPSETIIDEFIQRLLDMRRRGIRADC